MVLNRRAVIAAVLAAGWQLSGSPVSADPVSDEGREEYQDAVDRDEVSDLTPRVEVPVDTGADERDQVPDDIRTDRRQEVLAPGEPVEVPDAGSRDEVP
jgi:hypothetical protein